MIIGHQVLTDPEKTFFDAVSFVTAVGTVSNFLPHIAALFTIIWTGMRIGETLYGWFTAKKTDPKKD